MKLQDYTNDEARKNMKDLIFKTSVRALLIFVPFGVLSLRKETYSEEPINYIILGVVVVLILLGSLILSLIWRRQKRRSLGEA
jgi:hypothetical protein